MRAASRKGANSAKGTQRRKLLLRLIGAHEPWSAGAKLPPWKAEARLQHSKAGISHRRGGSAPPWCMRIRACR
jgi:hypothetical protein